MNTPPPLFVCFPDYDAFANAAQSSLTVAELGVVRSLADRSLPPLTSIRTLSTISGISQRFIVNIAKNPDRYYRTFTIPKGRSHRTIHSPRIALKFFQAWFGYHLAAAGLHHEIAHGFVPGRSIVSAASVHCNSRWMAKVDLRSFFPSVSMARVQDRLIQIGYPELGARLASSLLCLYNGLPQGSPASPALSNAVFAPMDESIFRWSQERGLRVSRYADDITISLPEEVPDEHGHDHVQSLSQLLAGDGWELAEEKTKIATGHEPMRTLGLLVDGPSPRLSRKYRHKIRMIEHLLGKGDDLQKLSQFSGHLAFYRSVH